MNFISVAIDIGGSATKIALSNVSSPYQFTLPVRFPNYSLFANKHEAGKRISQAILLLLKQHQINPKQVTEIAISMTGEIDHGNNILLLSHRLEQLQSTGNSYGKFDLGREINKALLGLGITGKNVNVYLLNDAISPALDPFLEQNLVLTLVLGTFPVFGLSQKSKESIKIYKTAISNWDQIVLDNGNTIQKGLKNSEMAKRDDLSNCKLILEAIEKSLQKYKQIFKWQPNSFVILGGNAGVLKHQKSWPSSLSHVKIIAKVNYDDSIHTQMRGAMYYSKNYQKIRIV